MRCKEILAFYAGIAALLMVSVFALGASTPPLQTVSTAASSPAVSVFDGSGPNTPLEGVDGDVALQHRHKAGGATASPAVQATLAFSSPDLHGCAADVARQHSAHPGSHDPARVQILRC
ncbi:MULTISPECIES: hypothetical protein [unclassified Streptomyces]|uniref:hypothetical protein n=1 Tax=unclassified Streptomyces TaxID=2593676 RepID=UPI003798007A